MVCANRELLYMVPKRRACKIVQNRAKLATLYLVSRVTRALTLKIFGVFGKNSIRYCDGTKLS